MLTYYLKCLLNFTHFLLTAKKEEGDEKDEEEEKGSADSVVVLELLSLARPFTALRGVDIDALALKIINKLK